MTPELMNDLLANRAFRAVVAARTLGVKGDSTLQTNAAKRVTSQIEKVKERRPGTFRYNLAVGGLMEYIRLYLNIYGENRAPYLPEGITEDSFS